jgi:pSer/pThr/pTyr-binding forkhead associated (FHA) protein
MRASEQHRERAVAALGRGYVDGQLSLDTFVGRLDRAFAARRIADLGSAPSLTGGRPLVLGRAPWCNLVLPEPTVSRRHAELRRDGAAWTIVDLGSRNGTWVNGWRVDRAAVRRGDRVHLGHQRLVVR